MACAIWCEKYNFNIFQSCVISWVCSTLVNEEQDFSVFFPPIWRSSLIRHSSKVAKVIHELELLCIWWGVFLYFWKSGVCFTCQLQVEVISLCHQHCSLAEQWPSALICSTMARITFVCHHLTGLEIMEESNFINIKYVLWLVSISYFGQFFAFPIHRCVGI